MKPTEADWNAENPVVVGLISMLTGTEDLQDIRTIIGRLHQRGSNILGVKLPIDYQSLTE